MGIDRRDSAALFDSIASFRSALEATRADGPNVLFITDDSALEQVLWDGLRFMASEMPAVCAFVDLGKMALSPSLLCSAFEFAVTSALRQEDAEATSAPWLTASVSLGNAADRLQSRIRGQLNSAMEALMSAASDSDKTPVLVLRKLTELRALKSYKGIDDLFAILGRLFAKFSELRIVVIEKGLSHEAVLEVVGATLGRPKFGPIMLSSLSEKEVASVASLVLGTGLSREDALMLRSLSCGRLSYLLWLCDQVNRSGASLERDELVSWVAGALLSPKSDLSCMICSRIEEAISSARGDTALRHILRIMSFEDGMTATEIAEKIGRSVPAGYDYANWLLRTLLVRKDDTRYSFRDHLLKIWIRLDTLACGRAAPVPAELAETLVLEMLESQRVEPREEPLELLEMVQEEPSLEDEEHIEVFRPRSDDILEFD
ncbi:MAG: hypothetical protein JW941_02335 [Candidatus Coatesbacteria bacterium]|nr:hypothetical protein [Candidatus Coatesbacteria bacterium]